MSIQPVASDKLANMESTEFQEEIHVSFEVMRRSIVNAKFYSECISKIPDDISTNLLAIEFALKVLNMSDSSVVIEDLDAQKRGGVGFFRRMIRNAMTGLDMCMHEILRRENETPQAPWEREIEINPNKDYSFSTEDVPLPTREIEDQQPISSVQTTAPKKRKFSPDGEPIYDDEVQEGDSLIESRKDDKITEIKKETKQGFCKKLEAAKLLLLLEKPDDKVQREQAMRAIEEQFSLVHADEAKLEETATKFLSTAKEKGKPKLSIFLELINKHFNDLHGKFDDGIFPNVQIARQGFLVN